MPDKEKRLLTVPQVAEILQVSERTLYNRTGRKAKDPLPFKAVRLGRSVRFRASDVYTYIESL